MAELADPCDAAQGAAHLAGAPAATIGMSVAACGTLNEALGPLRPAAEDMGSWHTAMGVRRAAHPQGEPRGRP